MAKNIVKGLIIRKVTVIINNKIVLYTKLQIRTNFRSNRKTYLMQ
jgi:hypothetical protein